MPSRFAAEDPYMARSSGKDDARSVQSNKSGKTGKTNASQRSVFTTLTKKNLFHMDTVIGDDDPLETLSQKDYCPRGGAYVDPSDPLNVIRPERPKTPVGPNLAPVGHVYERFATRVVDAMPQRKKGDTIEQIKKRDNQWDELQSEFHIYVEEQQMRGNRVENDFHQYTDMRQREAAQFDTLLQPMVPRARRVSRPVAIDSGMKIAPPPRERGGKKLFAKKAKPQYARVGDVLAAVEQQSTRRREQAYEEDYAVRASPPRAGYRSTPTGAQRSRTPGDYYTQSYPQAFEGGYDYGYRGGYGVPMY